MINENGCKYDRSKNSGFHNFLTDGKIIYNSIEENSIGLLISYKFNTCRIVPAKIEGQTWDSKKQKLDSGLFEMPAMDLYLNSCKKNKKYSNIPIGNYNICCKFIVKNDLNIGSGIFINNEKKGVLEKKFWNGEINIITWACKYDPAQYILAYGKIRFKKRKQIRSS
jgi:hypothetical protein